MPYIKGQPFKPKFDYPGGSIEFYVAGSSTPTPYYTDSIGTAGGTVATIGINNASEDDIFFDTAIDYDMTVKDVDGNIVETISGYSPGELYDNSSTPPQRVAATVATIRAGTLSGVTSIQTLGYYSAGDGGAALYRADTSDTSSADDGFLVIVSNDGVRFKLVYDHEIDPRWAGCRLDGTTDDSTNANKAASVGINVGIVPGTMLLSSRLATTADNQQFIGRGGKIKHADDAQSNMIELNHTGCKAKSVYIDGNKDNQTAKSTWNGEITINGRECVVDDATVKTSGATAIANEGREHVQITGNYLEDLYDNGILHHDGFTSGSKEGAKESLIDGNIINGTDTQNAIFVTGYKNAGFFELESNYPPRTTVSNNIGFGIGDVGFETNHASYVKSIGNQMYDCNGAAYLHRNTFFCSSENDTAQGGNGDHFGVTTESIEATIYNDIVKAGTFQWVVTTGSEYELQLSGGGDAGLPKPMSVRENGSAMTRGTVGSLAAGEWDYSSEKIIVRLSDSSDPDTKSDGFVDAQYDSIGPTIDNFKSFDCAAGQTALKLNGNGIEVYNPVLKRTRGIGLGDAIFIQGDNVSIKGGEIDGFAEGIVVNDASNDDREYVSVDGIEIRRVYTGCRLGGSGQYKHCYFGGTIHKWRDYGIRAPSAVGVQSELAFKISNSDILSGGTGTAWDFDRNSWIGWQIVDTKASSSTSYTLSPSDHNMKVRLTNESGPINVILPESANEDFPENFNTLLIRQSASQNISLTNQGSDTTLGVAATTAQWDRLSVSFADKGGTTGRWISFLN